VPLSTIISEGSAPAHEAGAHLILQSSAWEADLLPPASWPQICCCQLRKSEILPQARSLKGGFRPHQSRQFALFLRCRFGSNRQQWDAMVSLAVTISSYLVYSRCAAKFYESAALPLSYLGLGGDSYLNIRGKLVSILRRDRCAIHGPLDSYPAAKVNALPRKEFDLQQRRGLAGSIATVAIIKARIMF